MKTFINILMIGLALFASSCSDFLEKHQPQGSLDEEQLYTPEYVDNLVIDFGRGYKLLFLNVEL